MSKTILNKIEKYSKSIGFEVISLTDFSELNFYKKNLKEFIKKKYYGDMNWMKEKAKIREHPQRMWREAKSALVFGLNYGPKKNPLLEMQDVKSGYISIYARRKDYHKVLHERFSAEKQYKKFVDIFNGPTQDVDDWLAELSDELIVND